MQSPLAKSQDRMEYREEGDQGWRGGLLDVLLWQHLVWPQVMKKTQASGVSNNKIIQFGTAKALGKAALHKRLPRRQSHRCRVHPRRRLRTGHDPVRVPALWDAPLPAFL